MVGQLKILDGQRRVFMSHNDNEINSPSHYTKGGIDTIDFMEAKMTFEEYIGFMRGNVIKYISRSSFKGQEIKDLKKAAWYLNRLIDTLEMKQEIKN